MNNYNLYETYNKNNNNYDLFGAYEGYLKGNMFKNIYEQYKNYRVPTITPRNENEQDLFNLSQIGFAMHDLNLLLDVYPNNQKALDIFTEYKNIYNNLLNDYENKYGPLSVNETGEKNPFEWELNKFPWEVK